MQLLENNSVPTDFEVYVNPELLLIESQRQVGSESTEFAKTIVTKAMISALAGFPAVSAANHVTINHKPISMTYVTNKATKLETLTESRINKYSLLNQAVVDKSNLIKQILSFKSLINNWDGYGAIPLEINSACNAISLLNEFDELIVSKIHDLYPNPHGTISLMWENDINERVSLEVGNESFSYYTKNSQGPLFFDKQGFTKENVSKLIKQISNIYC